MKRTFEEALHFRHACKVFDTHKKIPSEELKTILESGRMSPSSFGVEPWKFLVIQDGLLKQKLSQTCWNPTKIRDCSDAIVLLSKKNQRSTNLELIKQFQSRSDHYKQILKKYGEYLDWKTDEQIDCWASKQVYIASGFIMMGAASLGIDSCPIEGFEKEKATKVLEIDTKNYEIAHMIALGYRTEEQPQRVRRDFDDMVEFI